MRGAYAGTRGRPGEGFVGSITLKHGWILADMAFFAVAGSCY